MIDLAHVVFSGVERAAPEPRTAARGGGTHWKGAVHREPQGNSRPQCVEPFAAWMLQRLGVEPGAYRANPLQRRTPACLRLLRVRSAEAARQVLTRRPELFPMAADSMLIGVSSFFRDTAVFAQLRDEVLPELLCTRRGVRVYAAGVSSGQELYSVAMLLDAFSALGQSELMGLDCRPTAIAEARAGAFADDDLAGLTEEQRASYFPMADGRRIASARLRSRIEWRCGDLLSFEDRAPRQLILFRNVAIYLEAGAAGRAWERLCGSLEPGGFLVAGKAEQPPRSMPLCRVGPCIYRRT